MEALKNSLDIVNFKISKIEDKDKNSYTSQVLKSFPLGMVGGSGKNNNALNKRRSNELGKTIENAKILTALYSEQSELERKINYIESGQKAKDEIKKVTRAEALAIYWKGLKPGDILELGNSNGNPTILKKSLKSLTTLSGCKWTALDIIGKEALKYL